MLTNISEVFVILSTEKYNHLYEKIQFRRFIRERIRSFIQ